MAKQKALPGMEEKSIKEIDDAAEAYFSARDKRMALTEKEVIAKDALLEAMSTHKVKVYKDSSASPPLVVTVVPGKKNVKVSVADEADHDTDDDGGEDEEKPKKKRKEETDEEAAKALAP